MADKHRHGWDCFRESGGYTNAMEVGAPLAERIESVYKTAYKTGERNGRAEILEILGLTEEDVRNG